MGKMKSQVMLESMQNELRWKEKMFQTQLQSLQKQVDMASLEKLKLQKQFTQFEAALHDDRDQVRGPQPPALNQPRQHTPRNKRLLMKHRYLEIENIDQEIARLKNDIISRRQISANPADLQLPPIYMNPESADASVDKSFYRSEERKPSHRRVRKTKRS